MEFAVCKHTNFYQEEIKVLHFFVKYHFTIGHKIHLMYYVLAEQTATSLSAGCNVRDRLSESKDVLERTVIKNLNEMEDREEYQLKILNRFTASENLEDK